MTPEEKTRIQTKIQNAMTHRSMELNDATLRKELTSDVYDLLKPCDFITEVVVQCDERNNTIEIIDKNSLVLDVYFKEKDNTQFKYWNFEVFVSKVNIKEVQGDL